MLALGEGHAIACNAWGGSGGPASGWGCGGVASSGSPWIGPFEHLLGSARKLLIATPAREGTLLPLSVTGSPGERVALLIGSQPGFAYVPQWKGVLLVEHGSALSIADLGTIPSSGLLQTFLNVPQLPAGVQSERFHLQAQFTDAQGARQLGSPSTLIVLDSAF